MANVGDYFVSRGEPTSSRVKAYTAPPFFFGPSRYITTLTPGTTIGPVEAVTHAGPFTAVLVRGYWMNVAKQSACGRVVWFAHRVPDHEVASWRRGGWRD